MRFINEYIEKTRKDQNYTQAVLTNGLSHYTTLIKLHHNDVYVERIVIDTLLQRLGVDRVMNENYLVDSEWDLEMDRKQILKYIEEQNLNQANKKLENYKRVAQSDFSIHTQFYLYAKALIDEQMDKPPKLIAIKYKKAICQTVPNFEQVPLNQLLLSFWEVHFIFRYALILEQVDFEKATEVYNQLLDFFEKKTNINLIVAKYYPKVVLRLSKHLIDTNQHLYLIPLCDRAIEYLIKFGNYTNLPAILQIKLSLIREDDKQRVKLERLSDAIVEVFEMNNKQLDWEGVGSFEIYSITDCNIIRKVIKARRKILKISQEDLAEGVCDVKTISRLENNKCKTNFKTCAKLLEKVNLTGDLISDRIPFTSLETYRLRYQISEGLAGYRYDEIALKLEILKSKVDMTNKINQQFITNVELRIQFQRKQITMEQLYDELLKILNLTLPVEKLFTAKVHYFSNQEVLIIAKLLQVADRLGRKKEILQWATIIEDYFTDKEFNENRYHIYTFCMKEISSIRGNMGDFEQSNKMLSDLLELLLEKDHCCQLDNFYIDIGWNYRKEIEQQRNLTEIEQKKYIRYMEIAYIFAELRKNSYSMDFIENEVRTLPYLQ
ncbi:MAG: hypothetical protein ATN36_02425 [Epulopiscium sp. Nele67-Bin005]|nr:MAG: hypothetical protein ATN36_02425 [Epulopiscium sp. Nele67-Bin005]